MIWLCSNAVDDSLWHVAADHEVIGPKTGKVLSRYRTARCSGRKLGGAYGQTERADLPSDARVCSRCTKLARPT